ncbi:uncharacterized protein [Watersipora subatra]|uniref:uncharacterized protein n=1 Tax=Watersipora subatra TaxID=2589382 RepID=UPI00355B6499
MYLPHISVLLGSFYITTVSCGILLNTDEDGNNGYYLYFSPSSYTWTSARQQCSNTGSHMLILPCNEIVKGMVQDWAVANDVWVTDSLNGCITLKMECLKTSSSIIGGNLCSVTELIPVSTDCSANKRYVLCTGALTAMPTTTTMMTTTTQPVTTMLTTAKPLNTTPRPQTDVTPERPLGTSPTQNQSGISTSNVVDEKTAAGSTVDENKHVGGMAGFILGLSLAKTDLLGLIIGVVVGTFFILSLICILCCACQGQNPRRPKHYDLADRESDQSLVGELKNDSNASTNTLEGPYKALSTEESSLDMNDSRSHSAKHSDHDVLMSAYPPPPTLYDTTPSVYNILPVNLHETRPNPLYDMTRKSISEELPLPPPPLPPHGVSVAVESEEETCVKGLTPSFKNFLDKTIAVKGLSQHRSSSCSPIQMMGIKKKGLITSDL